MCAINLWAVNAAAFTTDFRRFTAERIGVEPSPRDLRITSGRVRSSAAVFTLTRNMCDCGTFIGRTNDPPAKNETGADDWLSWLRDLPRQVPHLSRVSVLRAWNLQGNSIVPTEEHGIGIDELEEGVLRSVGDDHLLTIDYPGSTVEDDACCSTFPSHRGSVMVNSCLRSPQ